MSKKQIIFLDVFALTVIALLILILFGFSVFMIFLGAEALYFGIALALFTAWQINEVIYIDSDLHILSRFFIPKKVAVSQITKITSRRFGTSFNIKIYYNDKGKNVYSGLTFIGLFGNERLINFLNSIDHDLVDKPMFEKHFEIRYRDGEFRCH